MGLSNYVKDKIGIQKQEDISDIEDEFEEDDGFVEEVEEEDIAEEEETVQEWNSAYDFVTWFLAEDGFADGQVLTNKIMMHKMESSNMYRDRIKSGTETISMISNSVESIKSAREGSDSDTNYSELANELKSANEVIDQMDSLSGKDDMMVMEALELGNEFVDVLSERVKTRGGDVESNVEERDGEL